jgi:hypothetical protein
MKPKRPASISRKIEEIELLRDFSAACYGKNDDWLGSPVDSAHIFVDNIHNDYPQVDLGQAVGRVIAHELGHFALQISHDKMNPGPLEEGIMSPGASYIDDQSLAHFSVAAIPTLKALCDKLRAQGGGTGGGGGWFGSGFSYTVWSYNVFEVEGYLIIGDGPYGMVYAWGYMSSYPMLLPNIFSSNGSPSKRVN